MFTEGFGEMVERLRRATVEVRIRGKGHGSGIIVKPEGVVVTNAHVAANKTLELCLWDGSRTPAELLSRDVARDLAILRLPRSGLPAATLADSDRLQVGEPVVAIGNPLGFIGALTTGVVRAIGTIAGLGPRKWVQSDVRLAPGNSGGPLANASGVVGINTMVAGGMGLAVPSNSVSRLLQRRGAQAPLGVTIRPVMIRMRNKDQSGMLIVEITDNSAAESASLMTGDILVGVDGRYFADMEDFERAFDGDGLRVIRLHFLRGHRSGVRTVAVRLGVESPAAA